ncbi:hypothetical protein GWI33_002796, partial [Rhynchophorus ferrugineus]
MIGWLSLFSKLNKAGPRKRVGRLACTVDVSCCAATLAITGGGESDYKLFNTKQNNLLVVIREITKAQRIGDA